MTTLTIGSEIYVFDINRREYRKNEQGRSVGGPIWRSHWVKKQIVDETSRSWVLSDHTKVPKKNPPEHSFCFSEKELDERVWIHDNINKLADHIKSKVDSYALLREIAEMTGYDDAELAKQVGLY